MHIFAIKKPPSPEDDRDCIRSLKNSRDLPHERKYYFLISEAIQRMTTAPMMAIPS